MTYLTGARRAGLMIIAVIATVATALALMVTVGAGTANANNRGWLRPDATGTCDWDAVAGARQLHQVFRGIDLDTGTFSGRGHTRLLQLQHLINTGQLDDELFWRKL